MAGFEKMPSKLHRFLRDTPLVIGNVQANPAEDMHAGQQDQDNTNTAESDLEEGPDELGEQGVPAPVMVVDGRVIIEAPEDNQSDEDDQE
ncbi:hypothetical protein FRC07_012910 [Ceratobasidium sp. 392]|nr:hypothetical protein FRC07_012910 [Ceratobasidium sp. 392]